MASSVGLARCASTPEAVTSVWTHPVRPPTGRAPALGKKGPNWQRYRRRGTHLLPGPLLQLSYAWTPHLQEVFPRPELAVLPGILGRGGYKVLARLANLYPGGDELASPCVVIRAAVCGVLSRTENAPSPCTHITSDRKHPQT